MRPGRTDDEADASSRRGVFNLSSHEQTNFSLSHRHSGLHGDGQKIPANFIDWTAALPDGEGPVLTAPNGDTYRLGVDNAGAITLTGPL